MKTKTRPILMLNIDDPELFTFLLQLREILSGAKSTTKPHITIRGPYRQKPTKQIDKITNIFRQKKEVIIKGGGLFKIDNAYFVYLKVFNDDIEENMWKKNFPKKEYGTKPHLTVYKGSDKKRAYAILKFIVAQDINFSVKTSLSLQVENVYRRKSGEKQLLIDFIKRSKKIQNVSMVRILENAKQFIKMQKTR